MKALMAAALIAALTIAAKPPIASLVAPATVPHGGTVTYQASADGHVLTQCWNADGKYVYASWSVAADGIATEGPLASSLWPSGPGDCLASLGHFARNGRFITSAQTTFDVT